MRTVRTELKRTRELETEELIEEARSKSQYLICEKINFEHELKEDTFEFLTVLLSQALYRVVQENAELKFKQSKPTYDLQKDYLENRGN